MHLLSHHQYVIAVDMEQDVAGALVKLGLALLIGTIIGAEREYKNKSAGLRTLILICLGSTLFTMISSSLGAESETGRIAIFFDCPDLVKFQMKSPHLLLQNCIVLADIGDV